MREEFLANIALHVSIAVVCIILIVVGAYFSNRFSLVVGIIFLLIEIFFLWLAGRKI